MKAWRIALVTSWTVFACSMPEDSNPAQRCDGDETCPNRLECYRGFCLGTDDVLPEQVEDAGSIARRDAGGHDASELVTVDSDARVAQSVPEASTPTVQDLPGTFTTTTTSEPATASTTPTNDTHTANPPPATQPATPSAPDATTPTLVPCLAQCSNILDKDNTCRDCFRRSFGDDANKLCGAPAQFNPALATICALVCTSDKADGPLKCTTTCNGKNCGGE